MLIEGPLRALKSSHDESPMRVRPDYHEHARSLPQPILQEGKEMPQTIYTSKHFDTAMSTASSSLLMEDAKKKSQEFINDDKNWTTGTCGAEEGECTRGKGYIKEEQTETPPTDEDDEEHLPAGQHLLVDIKDVDASFLNSEERLAQAMIDICNVSKLTLLSYHCHKLFPSGISCAGVLLESHVSFHTWPEEGVITLDLFTCGSNPLLPVVPIIMDLFGIPHADGHGNKPSALWAHKQRGFRDLQKRLGHLDSYDLGRNILGVMDFDMKKEVASVQTKFQRVDIYDILYPKDINLATHERSLSNDDSYEAKHPELFKPDRLVFLDGIIQSRATGDESYHEGLIHPSMFAHPNPKRVAIIGGGEGASLREVLKHKTVEKCVMIEIDEIMVEVSRKNLPTWNTCADIEGSAESCFDDPRSDVQYENALEWFIEKYYDGGDDFEKFDIIIMDALDPRDNVEFADALYNNVVFLQALYNSLGEDGIMVMQLGESTEYSYPADEVSVDKNRAIIIGLMEQNNFESFHVYEEAHSGFEDPWTHLVACKSITCRQGWYKNAVEVDLAIRKRIIPSISGKPLLKYFDGATMQSYQTPHGVWQTVYCRKEPTPEPCKKLGAIDEIKYDVTWRDLEVKKSTVDKAGLGLFTTVDIAEGSSIYFDDSPIMFHPSSLDVMLTSPKENAASIFSFMTLYGEKNSHLGEVAYIADSNIAMFANHGCNGTNNVVRMFRDETPEKEEYVFDGEKMDESEMNLKQVLKSIDARGYGYQYNPLFDRKLNYYNSEVFYATRDIAAGEEITINYVSTVAHESDTDGTMRTKKLCV